MGHLLQFQDVIGTVRRTIAAVDTDLWLILLGIPEDRSQRAGFDTISTSDTAFRFKPDTTALADQQGVGGTDAGARRIDTSAADDDDKSSPHPARRLDVDAGRGDPALAHSPRASEHARLASHTAVDVDHGEPFSHNFSYRYSKNGSSIYLFSWHKPCTIKTRVTALTTFLGSRPYL
jgi:hypothetical protein